MQSRCFKRYTYILAVLALQLPLVVYADSDNTTSQVMEKCYGVVKAGRNDCDTNNGPASCAPSSVDADPNYWIYLPEGVCNKIVGGVSATEANGAIVANPQSNVNNPPNATLEATDADMRQDLKSGVDMGITKKDDLSTDGETDPDVVHIDIDAPIPASAQ